MTDWKRDQHESRCIFISTEGAEVHGKFPWHSVSSVDENLYANLWNPQLSKILFSNAL